MNRDADAGQDRPLDLSALDPMADPARFAGLGSRLSRAAAGELARRRARLDVWSCLAAWRRPVLATAGIVAVAASLVLATVPQPAESSTSLAEAAGVPGAWVQLARGSQAPTPEALLQLGTDQP